MSTPNPRGGATQRNPGPRPALRREGCAPDGALVVARPGALAAGEAAGPSPARIAVVPTALARQGRATDRPANGGKAQKGSDKGSAKDKPSKQDKETKKKDKRSKKNKAKGKKSDPPVGDLVPNALTVPLPKPLRRALAQAATERDIAPELLVAQVLSEWLDH